MLCKAFLPGPALGAYIKCFQLRHFIFDGSENLPFKPYAPRPEQTLAFYPRSLEQVEYVSQQKRITRSRSVLMGQSVERTNRHLGGPDFIVLLVNFHPGALYRITGMPYSELANSEVDAEVMFPKQMALVNERLNSADTYSEMIAIVEAFLLSLVQNIKKDAHPLDQITSLLIDHPENISLLTLAEEACLCRRQFERKFKERMGISPRLFTRIARLHKAFRLRYHSPQTDWLSIALSCSYYDYQHLVKDFQDLAGGLPTTYFLEEMNAPEKRFGMIDSSL